MATMCLGKKLVSCEVVNFRLCKIILQSSVSGGQQRDNQLIDCVNENACQRTKSNAFSRAICQCHVRFCFTTAERSTDLQFDVEQHTDASSDSGQIHRPLVTL